MRNLLINIGKKSKIAFFNQIDTKKKNKVLKDYYQLILKNRKLILNENIKDIKTAVLWKKKDSTFEPDFCAQKLNNNPWIVQPFERYEEVRVEDLVKKHSN